MPLFLWFTFSSPCCLVDSFLSNQFSFFIYLFSPRSLVHQLTSTVSLKDNWKLWSFGVAVQHVLDISLQKTHLIQMNKSPKLTSKLSLPFKVTFKLVLLWICPLQCRVLRIIRERLNQQVDTGNMKKKKLVIQTLTIFNKKLTWRIWISINQSCGSRHYGDPKYGLAEKKSSFLTTR